MTRVPDGSGAELVKALRLRPGGTVTCRAREKIGLITPIAEAVSFPPPALAVLVTKLHLVAHFGAKLHFAWRGCSGGGSGCAREVKISVSRCADVSAVRLAEQVRNCYSGDVAVIWI
jgi:hypothetical protein